MHRKIAAAVVAIALFTGTTTVSFAENAGGASTPSSGQAIGPGGASSPSSGQEQTIGSTSSTHNPAPSSSSPTGLNRKDGETGTDTSTHNPPSERR